MAPRVLFHVEADDYFGTLATVLDLLRQEIERRGAREKHAEVLGRVAQDLVYLQRNFRIERKIAS
jgi:hypothetical protein